MSKATSVRLRLGSVISAWLQHAVVVRRTVTLLPSASRVCDHQQVVGVVVTDDASVTERVAVAARQEEVRRALAAAPLRGDVIAMSANRTTRPEGIHQWPSPSRST